MEYIVYQTINIVNNKIYVGVHKTKDSNIFDGYLGCGIKSTIPSSYMNPTTPLQYAVKKYGTSNFKRSILTVFNNPKEAYALEAEIVNYDFIHRKDTYNAKLGGLGGCSYYTELNQFDKQGNFIKHWNSIVEAAEFLGVSHTAISNALKYKESCKSFLWAKEETININDFNFINSQIIYKYSDSGEFIESFNSIAHAARETNVSEQYLGKAIYGGYKVKNFYFSNKFYDTYSGKPKITIRNKQIYVYDLDGNFITQLTSKDIYSYFNIKTTTPISTALKTNKPYKQWQFNLEKVDKMNKVENIKFSAKEVECYTKGGDLVETFKTTAEAIKKYGTGVQRVLKGQQEYCKGFLFKRKS